MEDASGRPRGDLPVVARGEQAPIGPGGFDLTLPDGTFRLRGLAEGTYALVAGSEQVGYALRAGVRTGTSDVSLTLRPVACIRVRVLDAAGQPVAKAGVSVDSVGGAPVILPGRSSGQTDAAGMVELAGVEGSCTVQARHESRVGTRHRRCALRAPSSRSTSSCRRRPRPPPR